ncbi:MAG: transposase [Mycobacterium sp.]|nr:transposase [Mycobacterium sp.]
MCAVTMIEASPLSPAAVSCRHLPIEPTTRRYAGGGARAWSDARVRRSSPAHRLLPVFDSEPEPFGDVIAGSPAVRPGRPPPVEKARGIPARVIYHQYRHDRAGAHYGESTEIAKAGNAVAGKAPVKRNRYIKLTGANKSVNRDLETKARGLKGYTTNLTVASAEFVIDAYHQQWRIEKSFRMSTPDIRARPVCLSNAPDLEPILLTGPCLPAVRAAESSLPAQGSGWRALCPTRQSARRRSPPTLRGSRAVRFGRRRAQKAFACKQFRSLCSRSNRGVSHGKCRAGGRQAPGRPPAGVAARTRWAVALPTRSDAGGTGWHRIRGDRRRRRRAGHPSDHRRRRGPRQPSLRRAV